MNKLLRRGVIIENSEIRISKALATEKEINSKIRYTVTFFDDKIILQGTRSMVNSLKFYSFNNGYLKMIFKTEDIPDRLRSVLEIRKNAALEIESETLTITF